MNGDARGWRIALLPYNLMNDDDLTAAGLPDVLGIVESCGYGVLQLPPPPGHGPLLAVIADQIAEYARHGYAVAAVAAHGEPEGGLHWRSLAQLLRHRHVALPRRHLIEPDAGARAAGERLAAFLADNRAAAPGAAALALR